MRLISTFLVAAFVGCMILTACVSPVLSEDGVGVTIAPLASLPRVKEGEKIASDAISTLSDGQIALAEQVGTESVAAAAMAAAQKKELEEAILNVKDESAIDWTTILLAALGVGGVGAGGAAYRKKLLLTKPPKS